MPTPSDLPARVAELEAKLAAMRRREIWATVIAAALVLLGWQAIQMQAEQLARVTAEVGRMRASAPLRLGEEIE